MAMLRRLKNKEIVFLVYMKFAKKQMISALKDGQAIDDIFVVKIKKSMSSYAKGYTFNLILSDNSGKTIDYRYWGCKDEASVRAVYDSIAPNCVVHVKGKVSFYRENLQIATNEPDTIRVLQPEEYEPDIFIKKPKHDLDEMYTRLMEKIESIQSNEIKKLVKSIYCDPQIAGKIKLHPAAIEYHHNWIGGLVQHMLEMIAYCELAASMHPNLDKDMLIAGVLLHDIGKLEEINVSSRIMGSKKGQLLGHLALGFHLVSKKMEELDISEDTRDKILHIIVSHHGRLEFGSPKVPMFPEAVVIYYADEMSSKAAEIIEYIEDNKHATEDDFMYNKRKNRNIFLRMKNEEKSQ